jgi:hypothetical protein
MVFVLTAAAMERHNAKGPASVCMRGFSCNRRSGKPDTGKLNTGYISRGYGEYVVIWLLHYPAHHCSVSLLACAASFFSGAK